ncbi:hypothetical protein BRETT_003556 [Brettanomyces bruxellensis]|uniref:Uncharacterized protein n=1 Tax=Dekkera bruxellensis TaxID=5007 RepID=A0A871R173_DEKBR|nr:uncharacterized protein BRETT_003556 [Brettanomyces bruxellensis]QOU19409.1 hypothetical protein BRETT_003556 [Brettanomyces bruxellensis]
MDFYFNLDDFTPSWNILDHKFHIKTKERFVSVDDAMPDLMLNLIKCREEGDKQFDPVLCLLGSVGVRCRVSSFDQYDYLYYGNGNRNGYDTGHYSSQNQSQQMKNHRQVFYVEFIQINRALRLSINIPKSVAETPPVKKPSLRMGALEYLLSNLDLKRKNKQLFDASKERKKRFTEIASFKSGNIPEDLSWVDVQCYMNVTFDSLTITVFNRNETLSNYVVKVLAEDEKTKKKGAFYFRRLNFVSSSITVLSFNDISSNENVHNFSLDAIREIQLVDSKQAVVYSGKINVIHCKEFTSVGHGSLLMSKKDTDECKDQNLETLNAVDKRLRKDSSKTENFNAKFNSSGGLVVDAESTNQSQTTWSDGKKHSTGKAVSKSSKRPDSSEESDYCYCDYSEAELYAT